MKRIITLCLMAAVSVCLISSKSLDKNKLNDNHTIEEDCTNEFKKLKMSSTTAELPAGSIIIDMGVSSQNFNNGLKPYGLIYAIIKEYDTPVLWSINPNKSKDGVDFSVDGKNFRGGPFAISKEYLTPEIISKINEWKSQGVVTYQTSSNVSIPLYKELTFFPTWVLDKKNGKIAEKYLKNAGIPSTAYTKALPTALDECHDLFVLPHADPTWEDHGHLYDWNSPIAEGGNQGYIWSGCTAVSNLENLYNPNNPSQQLNFLATKTQNASNNGDDYFENALVLADNHEDASNTTHNIAHEHDPFMQFIGQSDGVHKGGKEEIYLPVKGGGWRPTTKVGIWDTNQEDLGSLSDGEAALMVYGPAFGDANRGQVMYQAGHDLNKDGSTAERVAAQRGFLNFSFDAASAKIPQIVMNNPEQREVTLTNGESITFDVTGIPILGGGITYEWSSSCSIGSFDTISSATPTFTIPETPEILSNETCIVTVKAIDDCGRLAFLTYKINFIVKPINCDITGIAAANATPCNDNGTSTTNDDFFTADITVTFTNPPATGLLFLSGGASISVSVDQLDSNTSHTFTNVQFPTNGNEVNLTAFFQKDVEEEEVDCTFNNPSVITAPESCSITPCDINGITAANSSSCNDNGTNDTNDDFFIADITVTFTNPPATGLLFLSGDASISISVDQLDSDTSHTFSKVQFPANGNEVNLTAFFQKDVEEEEVDCTFNNPTVITAPESCSFTPCDISAVYASNNTSCNDNGTGDANDDFFTANITVNFTNPPATGLLFLSGDASINVSVDQLDSATSHTFTNVQFPADGSQVNLNAFFQKDVEEEEIDCTFNNPTVIMAPESCSFTPCSITTIAAANNSSCNDNGTSDANDDFFTTDITISFTNPPATGELSLSGDATLSIDVAQLDNATSHTFTNIQFPADGNQVNLTAFFKNDVAQITCALNNPTVITAPQSCSITPCDISGIFASNNTSCNDNGTATVDDNLFTADITVIFKNPPATGLLLLSGDASLNISVDQLDSATSHTFTNVQFPADGSQVSLTAFFQENVEEEENECTFNNPTVITAPLCCTVETECNISSITAANSSSCNDNGTADNPSDDFFTTDITVTFDTVPTTGKLQLTGDTTASIDINQLDSTTSHTFIGVQLPANGNQMDVTSFFTTNGDIECAFNNPTLVTAPSSCSVVTCIINDIAITSTTCEEVETKSMFNDEFIITSNITVTFSNTPETGFLEVIGEGIDTIKIRVSDLDSNTSHTFRKIEFAQEGNFNLSAFFMTNEAEAECLFNKSVKVSCTGKNPRNNGNKVNFKDVNIHPNPSKGNVTIETPYVKDEVRVSVYDLSGKLILNKLKTPNNKTIELNGLPQGVLLVRLKSRGNSIVKKLIID